MKKIVMITVAGLAASASAQTIAYNLSGQNLTQGTPRGNLVGAAVGDTIRIWLSADHDGLSIGLAKFDILMDGGATPGQVMLDETATAGFDLTDDLAGRHPHMRQATSDKPTAGGSGASLITAFATDGDTVTLSDAAQAGIDLGTFPPTFNPLIGLFPISTGEQFFAFDFVYQGGVVNMSTVVRGAGRIYRNSTDGNGQSVSAPTVGTGVTITPAPASLALLGLGGLVANRRRRA